MDFYDSYMILFFDTKIEMNFWQMGQLLTNYVAFTPDAKTSITNTPRTLTDSDLAKMADVNFFKPDDTPQWSVNIQN